MFGNTRVDVTGPSYYCPRAGLCVEEHSHGHEEAQTASLKVAELFGRDQAGKQRRVSPRGRQPAKPEPRGDQGVARATRRRGRSSD